MVYTPMNIKLCPQCKSSDITLDTGGQTGKWLCKKCGYVGVLVLEKTFERNKNQ